MADTYKVFQGTLSYGSTTTLYTVPADKMFYLKGFFVSNLHASDACDCRVDIGTTPVVPNQSVPSEETLMLNELQAFMTVGETLTGESLTTGHTLYIRAWGIEVAV
jgi:hypothetical protein